MRFFGSNFAALMRAGEKHGGSGATMQAELSDPPSISDAYASATPSNRLASVIVARPSVAAGSTYKQVSKVYIDAVHSVLTGEKEAPEAAAELEKQLIEITGFSAAHPKSADKWFARLNMHCVRRRPCTLGRF